MCYSHTYQLLPLIPVEEFLAQHPEHADDDENALMVARINHERAEREALELQRLELQKRKQKLIAENKKRRDDLANLDKDLEKFIDVSGLLVISRCRGIWTNTGWFFTAGCQTYSENVREGGLRLLSMNPRFVFNCLGGAGFGNCAKQFVVRGRAPGCDGMLSCVRSLSRNRNVTLRLRVMTLLGLLAASPRGWWNSAACGLPSCWRNTKIQRLVQTGGLQQLTTPAWRFLVLGPTSGKTGCWCHSLACPD